jgi:hypothetical protein
VLGANAVDFGGNTASAATVAVTSVPDPLTTVVGRTISDTGQPLSGVTLTVGALSTTSAGNGTFVLPNVPTVQNTVVVVAATVLDGKPATGRSQPTPVVPLGTTSVGDIVVRVNLDPVPIVPANPASLPVVNCIPFGDTLSYQFTGFIYRNVPAFELQAGDTFAFDLGSVNDVDIRRNIYFAVANINPAAGGNPQGVRALSWTKVTSETQTPLTPRGDSIKGNYELTYTADAPFSFPGGGFIVGFGGTPPGTYVDGGCHQVLVSTTYADPSGNFHRRFYSHPDQSLQTLDDRLGTDNNYLGGIIIRPQQ